jgi:hypothetical protein
MEIVIVACLAGSALIHLLPLIGALGPSHVANMYDVKVDGPDLAVLLVHRAILFGLLAAGLIAAIFCEDARPYAIGAVLVSDVAFLAIAGLNSGINDKMKRVVRADIISIGLLAVAALGLLAD